MLTATASLLLTLGLVISRPRIGRFGRLNPVLGAAPGVAILLATGVLRFGDLFHAMRDLWRPLVTIASVMTTTSVAHKMGIFDRVTRSIEIRTRGSVGRAFATVFVIGVLTATAFNNDAAVLLLTPIIVPVIRRLYPKRQYLVEPFAFAIFMAAGVAPLSTSNPMNLVVAERAGLGFNAYAIRMIPVSLVASLVSYGMLRVVLRDKLEDGIPARGAEQGSLAPMEGASQGVLAVVAAMFLAYPILSYFDGPVWVAAAVGASIISVLGLARRAVTLGDLREGVAWDVLAFLFLVFVTAMGLGNAGLVDLLARVYGAAGEAHASRIGLVGTVAALGSAVLNNHPMAALNSLAVSRMPGNTTWPTLAALVGGDLGPRLLPMGSLAGLLWVELARRHGVEIRLREFVRLGVLVTVPAVAAALATLWIESLL